MRIGKIFIVANSTLYVVFGLSFVFFSEPLVEWLDITLQSPTAHADFKAIYGGLPLAVGVLFAFGLKQKWYTTSLTGITLCSLGILLGRLQGVMVEENSVAPFIYVFALLEAFCCLLGLFLLRQNQQTELIGVNAPNTDEATRISVFPYFLIARS